MERVVLAYSAGLESSVAVPWLRGHLHAEIVAVTMDLGQERDLEAVRDRALASGAVRAHVLDLREAFAGRHVLPALKADALYDDRSPMTAALARPLIASQLVEIAEIEQTRTVAHGGGGNGKRVALDVLIRALAPKLKILTPARDSGMSRDEMFAYARQHGIPSRAPAGPYRAELNLWGRAIACHLPGDEWREPPDEIYTMTRAARECPDEPAYVDVAFERGVPAAINGVALPMMELVASLGTIASAHGVGRIDLVEYRMGSSRLREVAEAPAAVLLYAAHRELRKAVSPRELERFSRTVSAEYADIVHAGLWFSPLRTALDRFVDAVNERMTGTVRLKLFKGAFSIVGRHVAPAPAPSPQPRAVMPMTGIR